MDWMQAPKTITGRYMNQGKKAFGSIDILRRDAASFKVTASELIPGFSLMKLLTEVTSATNIKKNIRRQVTYLQTPTNGYFLKYSTLSRRKDQWRHFLLPFRKWTEWRNLHRLWKVRIPAAKPIAKGIGKGPPGVKMILFRFKSAW